MENIVKALNSLYDANQLLAESAMIEIKKLQKENEELKKEIERLKAGR